MKNMSNTVFISIRGNIDDHSISLMHTRVIQYLSIDHYDVRLLSCCTPKPYDLCAGDIPSSQFIDCNHKLFQWRWHFRGVLVFEKNRGNERRRVIAWMWTQFPTRYKQTIPTRKEILKNFIGCVLKICISYCNSWLLKNVLCVCVLIPLK